MAALRYVPMDALAFAVFVGLFSAAAATSSALRRRDAAAAMLTAARVLLVGALLAILAVTMMKGADGRGVNLVPGSGIRAALNNVDRDLGLLNLVGNVVMFAPVGFLLPLAAAGVAFAAWLRRRSPHLLSSTAGEVARKRGHPPLLQAGRPWSRR